MRIPTIKLPLTTPLPQLASKAQLLNSLRPGQVLQATALSENRDGNVMLRIGAAKLTAQTQLAVRAGQPLVLQVDKTDPLPELKLLGLPTQKQLQAGALRQVLPRQQPLSALFDKLVDTGATAGDKSLPATLKQEIQALLSRLPAAENPASKQQLEDPLMQSGILSEARLMQGSASANDMKLNLLKLIALVQSLLPRQTLSKGQGPVRQESSGVPAAEPPVQKTLVDLGKQLDGALARVQLNQLLSLPQEDPARQMWQFELPMRQGDQVDLFQFKLKREPPSSDQDETPSWSLDLRMNLTPLGPMRIQLRLQDNRISALVWSENAATTELVKGNLNSLQDAFDRAGLEVKRIAAFTADVEEDSWIPSGVSLLDETA